MPLRRNPAHTLGCVTWAHLRLSISDTGDTWSPAHRVHVTSWGDNVAQCLDSVNDRPALALEAHRGPERRGAQLSASPGAVLVDGALATRPPRAKSSLPPGAEWLQDPRHCERGAHACPGLWPREGGVPRGQGCRGGSEGCQAGSGSGNNGDPEGDPVVSSSDGSAWGRGSGCPPTPAGGSGPRVCVSRYLRMTTEKGKSQAPLSLPRTTFPEADFPWISLVGPRSQAPCLSPSPPRETESPMGLEQRFPCPPTQAGRSTMLEPDSGGHRPCQSAPSASDGHQAENLWRVHEGTCLETDWHFI